MRRRSMAYIFATVAAYLTSTLGADVWARTTYGGQDIVTAVQEHLIFYTLDAIGGLIFMVIPFVVLGVSTLRIADRVGERRATIFFLIWAAFFFLLYRRAFSGAAQAMIERKWTAASLSLGLTLMIADLVSGITAITAWFVGRIGRSG